MEEEEEGQPTPIKSDGRKKEMRIAMCEESKGREVVLGCGSCFFASYFLFLLCRARKIHPLLPPVRPLLLHSLPSASVYIYMHKRPSLLPSLPLSLVVPRPSLLTKNRESRRSSIAHRALTLPPSLPLSLL